MFIIKETEEAFTHLSTTTTTTATNIGPMDLISDERPRHETSAEEVYQQKLSVERSSRILASIFNKVWSPCWYRH